MGKDAQSRCAAARARSRRSDRTVRLGEVVEQVVAEHISPRQSRFAEVVEVWSQLLPEELSRHCEIVDIAGGLLMVKADSPAYVYELQLCTSGLLDELQRQCPRVRLKKIKFVVG